MDDPSLQHSPPALGQSNSVRQPPRVPDHQLLRCIGRGSYGEVWLARSVMDVLRAVKVVYRDSFSDDRPYEREFEGVERFEPISRSHAGLVDILQVGRNEAEGYFYYVMELADGVNSELSRPASLSHPMAEGGRRPGDTGRDVRQSAIGNRKSKIGNWNVYIPKTLAAAARLRGRVSVPECVGLGLAITEAMRHLHEHGLVHRDVKPSNIIFVDGVPKLADIGLVTGLDATKSLVGTEGFVAPEGPGTPQADLYSLGKVLYELSTGKDRQRFPEPLSDQATLPDRDALAELNEVLLRACENDPRRRYAGAAEMHDDLALLAQGKSLARLRRLERRVARLTRLGLAAAVAISLGAGAITYQQHQNRRVQRLADANRAQLVRSNVANGVRLLEEGDYLASLPWFVAALKLDQGDPQRAAMHRYRIQAVLDLCPRLVALGAHSNRISYAEFSRDGERIVTASADGSARVWDVATSQPVTPPLRHKGEVDMAVFSPDGTRVASTGGDRVARVWDASTGRLICASSPHADVVKYVAFSTDGERVATASDDATARLWDARTGAAIGTPMRHDSTVHMVTFSRDNRWVVTASSDATARVWKATNAEPCSPPLLHSGQVRFAAFSGDGGRLATASRDGSIRLWSTATWEAQVLPVKHTGTARYVTFAPDGRCLATTGGTMSDFGTTGEAMLWDIARAELLVPPMRHMAPAYEIMFSPDGRWVLSASSDETVRRWSVETGGPLPPFFRQHTTVRNAALHPNGRQVLTSGRDGLWRLWDLANAVALTRQFRFHSPVDYIEFSPDGKRLLIVPRAEGASVWDVVTGRLLTPTLKDSGPVGVARLSSDGRLIVGGGRDGRARVWDASSGEAVSPWLGQTGTLSAVAFSPDCRFIATASTDKIARIWNAKNGEPMTPPLVHRYPVLCITFSPDGTRLVTGCGYRDGTNRGEVRVWDVAIGKAALPRVDFPGAVGQLVCSPNGRRFVIACEGLLPDPRGEQVWDLQTGQPVGPPWMPGEGVAAVSYSTDGLRIATGGGDGAARVWDATTGHPLSKPLIHRRGVRSIAFSPDGMRLATATGDGNTRIWDTRTGEPITPPLEHRSNVRQVAFSPDGQRLAMAGGPTDKFGEVRVWELQANRLPLLDLERIARLLAAAQVAEMSALEGLSAEIIARLWSELRSKHPELFSVSREEVIRWHQTQAEECEHGANWHGARFHLNRLLAIQPSNVEFSKRRQHAQIELNGETGIQGR